jgi:hypothetical protein
MVVICTPEKLSDFEEGVRGSLNKVGGSIVLAVCKLISITKKILNCDTFVTVINFFTYFFSIVSFFGMNDFK